MPVTGRWVLEHTGQRPPTVNGERKGGTGYFGRSRYTKEWRKAFAALAQAAGIPRCDVIEVIATPLHKDGRSPQDVGACMPAVKAAIDGLVDAGVVAHDGPDRVAALLFQAPSVCGVNGLRLTVVAG